MQPYLTDATPEENEFAELCNWLYSQPWGAVGGPLHIILDDQNLEDAHIGYCKLEIDRNDHIAITPQIEDDKIKCRRILEILGAAPFRSRLALLSHAESFDGPY